MSELNSAGDRLASSLIAVQYARNQDNEIYKDREKMHVVGAGRALSGAYEQLRNAAEYAEETTFMQRAVRRFFRRTFMAAKDDDIASSGQELVTDLTLAGYLSNDSISQVAVEEISRLAQSYFTAFQKLERVRDFDKESVWTVDVLSVEVALLLTQEDIKDVFLQYAFEIFLHNIDWETVFTAGIPDDYEILLYVALHRALLRSEDATIRRYLLHRFQRTPEDYANFIASNRQIDELLQKKSIDMLTRLVSRHGASIRVLGAMIRANDGAGSVLADRQRFLREYESQIEDEYDGVRQKVRSGVIKSIVFLIITKFMIGVAGEIPYDFAVHGSIVWLPLIVNFLAPVLYLLSVGFTLEAPGPANTKALVRQIDAWLYEKSSPEAAIKGRKPRNNTVFNMLYAIIFVSVFGLVSWGLVQVGYDVVHLAVFFLFFSAASFLGFRLSRSVREIEAVDQDQSGAMVLRDFVYMPFIVVGQKINQQYARVNFVATILDVVIEMPLKSVLRFVRQWSAFISSKKDEL